MSESLQPQSDEQKPADPTPEQASAELELKSARTLTTVATIAGPVSFIIGGVALSTVGLVCAIVAFAKVRRAQRLLADNLKPYVRALRQSAIMAMVISGVALVINGIGVALMMPILLDAMQTGDYSAILGEDAVIDGASSGSTGGGAWG